MNNASCSIDPPCRRKYGEMLSDPIAVLRRDVEQMRITSSKVNDGGAEISGSDGMCDRYSRTCSSCIFPCVDVFGRERDDVRARWIAKLLSACCCDNGGALVSPSTTEASGMRGAAAHRFHIPHSSLYLPSSNDAAISFRH